MCTHIREHDAIFLHASPENHNARIFKKLRFVGLLNEFNYYSHTAVSEQYTTSFCTEVTFFVNPNYNARNNKF